MHENPYEPPSVNAITIDDTQIQRTMLIIALAISSCIITREGLQNHGITPKAFWQHVLQQLP